MIPIRSRKTSKNVPITSMDSLDIFKQRVASYFDTLPSFILYENLPSTIEEIRDTKPSLVITSLMEEIQAFKDDYATNVYTLEPLFKLAERFPHINKSDIFAYWVIDNPKATDISLKMIIEDEISRMPDIDQIDDILYAEKRDGKWLKKYRDDVKNVKELVERFYKVAERFEKVRPVPSTDIYIEKNTLEIETSLRGISIEDLFNNIECNLNIPFCSYSNFYKILDPKSVGIKTYRQEDLEYISNLSLPNDIVLKYQEEPIDNDTILSKIPDIVIYNKNDVLHLSIEINIKVENKDEYINKMIEILNESITDRYVIMPVDKREKSIVASYLIPVQTIDPYVYADILMMNSAIASYFSNDESIKATKKKTVIFTHFSYEGREDLFSVKNMKAERLNEDVLRYRDVIKMDMEYVKVKLLKCSNMREANEQRNLFLKVISLYNDNYNKIVQYYKSYIKDFKPIEKAVEVKAKPKDKMDLKDIDPELFGIEGYTRMCSKKPTIIDDDQVNGYEDQGMQVMKFPKDGAYGTQRSYICKHDTHPYPGVSENQNEDNQMYPYVPCCFADDQTIKQNSGYRIYYEDLEKTDIVYQQIFTTNKFAPFNWYAYLPKTLDSMLTLIDNRFKYIRKGVSHSKSSFLECILDALEDRRVINKDKSDRIKSVQKIRKNLSTKDQIRLGFQSNWGMTEEEIASILSNPDMYIDPVRFCSMFEDMFKVNIYIFRRDADHPLGTIVYERSKFVDIHSPVVYDRSICIYEHMGSESDRAKYPMCELIGQWKGIDNDKNRYVFEKEHPVDNGVKWFYRHGRQYYKKQSIVEQPTALPFDSIISSQVVDSYGKTRGFILSFKNNPIVVNTSPLFNFDSPVESLNEGMDSLCMESEWKYVDEFIKEYALPIDVIYAYKDKCIGIESHYGDIIIRIKTTVLLSMVDNSRAVTRYENPFSDIEASIMNMYIRNRRFANILKNLFMRDLSRYWDSIKRPVLTRDDIYAFVKSKILVDPKFSYDNITPDIYMDRNTKLYKKDKLIINNQEILIRLVYFARLFNMRSSNLLRAYKDRTTCEGFYIDVYDFEKSQTTIIFGNSESLINMNKGVTTTLTIVERISNPADTIILRNQAVEGGKIVKLDLVPSYEDALRITRSEGIYVCRSNSPIIKQGDSPKILCFSIDDQMLFYIISVL